MKRSRQSYYKALKRQEHDHQDQDQVMELVRPIRQLMPRIGGKKLYALIRKDLLKNRVRMGRDKFFRWLDKHALLVKPKRAYRQTTNSNHRFWVYENLLEGLQLYRPNQLWVSDITYIRTLEGFCYLALITDAYSRKVVGYDISDSLELDGCLRALRMAIGSTGRIVDLIHHSDRGIQYCSGTYTEILKAKGIFISMAAKGDCYENALAERVNGILKDEFNLDATFRNKQQAICTTHQSIYIYNQHRPHWSINLQTPNARHAA